jgi:beta-aspartyl-peptidase (threonine type)
MKTILAIHGGAGTISRELMSSEKEQAYTAGLECALKRGWEVYQAGGSSVDMVEAAVVELENNILFNAGKGAVFTHEGAHELDASMMEGLHLEAGAVAGIRHTENPVRLARMVMENSDHVLLTGEGAESFARSKGLPFVENNIFSTELRREQLEQALLEDRVVLDHVEKKFGTVGAVALDKARNLAAATSTGGMTNKRYGRVGDTPLIGSGTYANNDTCAVSCTGHGEFFIRYVVAYDVACLMKYKGFTIQQAAELVVNQNLKSAGGEGGLIALDRNGQAAMPFNSPGMYRGALLENGTMSTGIF